MPRFTTKSSKKAGSSPGTLVHVGEKKSDDIHLSLLHYDADSLVERPLDRFEDASPLLKPAATTWINIDGVHDIDYMALIGRQYGLHPLTMEDVLNTTQRPKIEDFDDYIFVVMKMLRYDPGRDRIFSEQISLVLGKEVPDFLPRRLQAMCSIRYGSGSGRARGVSGAVGVITWPTRSSMPSWTTTS